MPEGSQHGETEKDEIGERTNRSERDRTDVRILAAQNLRTTRDDRALKTLTRHILNGQINRIAQANQRD